MLLFYVLLFSGFLFLGVFFICMPDLYSQQSVHVCIFFFKYSCQCVSERISDFLTYSGFALSFPFVLYMSLRLSSYWKILNFQFWFLENYEENGWALASFVLFFPPIVAAVPSLLHTPGGFKLLTWILVIWNKIVQETTAAKHICETPRSKMILTPFSCWCRRDEEREPFLCWLMRCVCLRALLRCPQDEEPPARPMCVFMLLEMFISCEALERGWPYGRVQPFPSDPRGPNTAPLMQQSARWHLRQEIYVYGT